jgi:tetratricopeptide (TPR) repeat protein
MTSDVARALRDEAAAARRRDDFPEAERLARRAADAADAAGDARGRALAISIAASALFRQGRLGEAEDLLRTALAYGPERGRTLTNLALVVATRGRPAEALDLYDEALTALADANPRHKAIALTNMGMLFERLDLLTEAMSVYELAQSTLDTAGGPEVWRTRMNVTNNQGVVLRKLGCYADAAERYETTLKLAGEDGDRRGEAAAFMNLALLAALAGDHRTAEIGYTRALGLRRDYGDPAEVADTLYSLGRLQMRRQSHAAAVERFAEALELRRAVGDPADIAKSLLALGRALLADGRRGEARASLAEGCELVEDARRAIPRAGLRQAFVGVVGALFGELALLVAEDDVLEGLEMAEAGRARTLQERLASASPAADAALVEERRGLQDELERLRDDPQAPLDRRREVELRRRLGRIAAVLECATPGAARGAVLDAVAGALGRGRALVSFTIGRERGMAVIVDAAGQARLRWLPGSEELEARVLAFTEDVVEHRAPAGGEWLRDVLLAEIPDDAAELVIIPDGPLHDLPWAALPGRATRYLAGERAIRVGPSATVFAWPRASREHELELVAFAAPGGAESHDEQRSSTGVSRRRAPATPIARTVDEVQAIAGLFGQRDRDDVIVRTHERATLQELERLLAQHGAPRYLHLACHGIVYRDEPSLSGVALSAPGGSGVEVWRMAQIADTSLDCEVVVLAACETASGRALAGEGVLSLGNALMSAGAHHVCVALWDVEDEAAAELMLRFYEGLRAGEPPANALAAAQTSLLETQFAHPFHWAWAVLT